MEQHPEQYSEWARLEIRRRINDEYSKFGQNIYQLAYMLLDLRPSEAILDIGCGFGDFLLLVRGNGHLGKLVGVDRRAEVAEEARNRAGNEGLWIDVRTGELERTGYQSGGFDCVTSLNVLGRRDPEPVLAEMGRLLKADGRVVVSANSRICYPIFQSLMEKARSRFGWLMANEWSEGFISERAPEILRKYFGEVEEFRYEDALQYPDAEVLVEFFRSMRGSWGERLSGVEWERIVDWVRDQAIELIPEHSYAEDPKNFSLFRCEVPLGL